MRVAAPLILIAAVATLSLPHQVAAQPAAQTPGPSTDETKPVSAPAFPFPVVEKTLSNGLRVYVVTFDSPGLVAYYSVVRVGSRNEVEPGKSGFAHFFEHMMFRGTDRYSQEAYNAEIKKMGADSNAFTSDDFTAYHILASKQSLPKIVELEADRFQNLKYKEAEFQKEARAVRGEYAKSASNPMLKMYEALQESAFSKHTYRHTTIGFLRDIEAMPQQFDYSLQFFDRYYRPDNTTLLVVGDVNGDDVFPLIEQHYGAWKKGPARPSIPAEPMQTVEQRSNLGWDAPTLPLVLAGWHTPGFSTSNLDVQALDVLAELLCSERAPLYKRLVIKEQKLQTLSCSNDTHIDPFLFTAFMRVKKPEDLAYVEKALHDEIARLGREGIDEANLKDVLSSLKYSFAGGLSTADRIATTAAQFIVLGGAIGAINAYYAQYQRVTSADVQRVARRYFKSSNRTVIMLKGGRP
jgi:zinc protease